MKNLLIGLAFLVTPSLALAAEAASPTDANDVAEQTTEAQIDPATAKTPTRAEARKAEREARDADPDRMICRQVRETGSRVTGKRICLTKRQWELAAEQTRREVENMQGPAAFDNHHAGATP